MAFLTGEDDETAHLRSVTAASEGPAEVGTLRMHSERVPQQQYRATPSGSLSSPLLLRGDRFAVILLFNRTARKLLRARAGSRFFDREGTNKMRRGVYKFSQWCINSTN